MGLVKEFSDDDAESFVGVVLASSHEMSELGCLLVVEPHLKMILTPLVVSLGLWSFLFSHSRVHRQRSQRCSYPVAACEHCLLLVQYGRTERL